MSKLTEIICPVLGTEVAGYGIYAFIHRDLFTYMLLENEFVNNGELELPTEQRRKALTAIIVSSE